MEKEQVLKFIIGKKFYNSENLITSWVDESKKEFRLVLYVGRFRIAQISENRTDANKKKYVVTHRIPQVRKNIGSFDIVEQAVQECESLAKFFISQISSEL